MQNTKGTRRPLQTTTLERDLGVFVSDNLSVRVQVESAATTANSILGRLKKSFRSRDIKLWRILYTSYIRPHLEFAVQVWCPYQRSDINILERVQQRAPVK